MIFSRMVWANTELGVRIQNVYQDEDNQSCEWPGLSQSAAWGKSQGILSHFKLRHCEGSCNFVLPQAKIKNHLDLKRNIYFNIHDFFLLFGYHYLSIDVGPIGDTNNNTANTFIDKTLRYICGHWTMNFSANTKRRCFLGLVNSLTFKIHCHFEVGRPIEPSNFTFNKH